MSDADAVKIDTECGTVIGVREGKVLAFYGLRYAEPPVGQAGRFRPPRPLRAWEGEFRADAYGPTAQQPAELPYNPRRSEDCLTLNVWTGGTDHPHRPVLLYIHGGGFATGSGSNPLFHGGAFAEHDELVVVTINYRLGAFGFLDVSGWLGEAYASSGNCGLLDVIEALRWLQRNIGRFGGDPSRVTIMGQSAGAKCVAALLCSPLADGLFAHAIAQSGAIQSIRDRETAALLTEQYMAELGVPPQEANRVLELPPSDFMAAQRRWCNDFRSVHQFGPVKDGVVLPEGHLTIRGSRPLLIGTNRNEIGGFLANDAELRQPSEAYVFRMFGKNAAIVREAYERRSGGSFDRPVDVAVWEATLTDYLYRYACIRTADAAATVGADVWMYRFDLAGPHGAAHGNELAYLWKRGGPHADAELAERMRRAWVSFIRDGSPRSAMPEWPRYEVEAGRRAFLKLDRSCASVLVDDEPEAAQFPLQALQFQR
jgi:para-nitrobenzyl esterase